jgi:hypothetical protein
MSYLFEDEEITSVADLLSWLEKGDQRLREKLKRTGASKPPIWFRGLRRINHPQIPTFHREGCRIEDEIYLMNRFKQNSHELLTLVPDTEWDWMFIMRHHNLPSRLLDWTENPLIGLYFAVRPNHPYEGYDTPRTDGVLWCLLPTRLNHWSLNWPQDDDALPMLSNNPAEYPCGENEAIRLYLPSGMKTLSSREKRPPAAGICLRTNRRMQAQISVFTVHHADKKPLEGVGDSSHVWRYRIPYHSKHPIHEELRRFGITERILFPSLDNVAKEAAQLLRGD